MSDQTRRRQVACVVAVLVAGIATASVVMAGRSGETARPHRSTVTNPSVTRATGVTTSPLATMTSTMSIVDPSRHLSSGGTVISDVRSLPTSITRPVGPGRFPLVVFVHGYGVGPGTYARFIEMLASNGFVVAAPSFPFEDPRRGNGLDRGDLPQEAVDVSFVISSISHSPLARHLLPHSIAVVGHSDGADVALSSGYGQAAIDRRIGAVVSIAPDPMVEAVVDGGPPLLLIHGSADQVVDPASSSQVFSVIRSPRWSLTLEGADHASAIIGSAPQSAPLDEATVAFLKSALGTHDTSTLADVFSRLDHVQTDVAAGP
ncbi:MAG: hypothetical protein WCI12_08870 [Actinomycetes bacterium]